MAATIKPERAGLRRGNRIFEALYSRLVLSTPRLHAALLRILLPDRETDIELFGARLRVNVRKEAGYWRAYRNARSSGVFWNEAASLISVALVLQPGDTFVDVGANVGLFSATLARVRHIHPSVRFYAYEANPDTAARLRKNVDGSVEVAPIALSNRDAPLTFVSGTSSLTFGVADSGNALQLTHRTVELEARRLDEMDIEGNSVVLKIDVENHERQVLEGATRLFDAGRIKAVFVDGYADPTVPEFLVGRGFSLFDGRTLRPGPSPTLLAIRLDARGGRGFNGAT